MYHVFINLPMVCIKVLYLVLFFFIPFTLLLISNSSVKHQFYVDDTQLIFSAASCSHLFTAISGVFKWMSTNFLNPSKTEFLINWYYSTTLWTQLSNHTRLPNSVSLSPVLALLGPWCHPFLCSTHLLAPFTVRNQFTNEGHKFSKVSSFREAKPRLIPTRSFAPEPHLGLLRPRPPSIGSHYCACHWFHLTMLRSTALRWR